MLLQFTGVTAVFAVAAGSSLLAAAMMLRVHYQAPPRPPARRMHLLPEISEGVRAVVRNRELALLVGLTSVQTFTRGALTVFTVVVAIDLLQIGEPVSGHSQPQWGRAPCSAPAQCPCWSGRAAWPRGSG